MAIIDSYRNSKISKQKELAKLTTDKAKEFSKISDLNRKINSASDAMKRTKSISTINFKLKEIERYQKDIATTNKKIADIETKIGKKEKEIFDYQTKIDKEQSSIDKKKNYEAKKVFELQERNLRTINSTLNQHNKLHLETINEIEKYTAKNNSTFFSIKSNRSSST